MALSDREQKLLEQMEKALYAEDPKFASSLRRSGLTIAPGERRHVIFGLLCLVAGLALVFGSVVSKMVIVGIPGFLLVLTGFVFIARGLQEPVAASMAYGLDSKKKDGFWQSFFVKNQSQALKDL